MEGHHRALAEAEQHHLFGQQILVHHQRVEKGVEVGGGCHQAALGLFLGRAVDPRDREPLQAEGHAGDALGGVGGDEQSIGKMLGQRIGEAEEVVAIGAVAVQEHHRRARLSRLRVLAARLQNSCHAIPSLSLATW
jgi:hypothetical protein